MLFRGTQSKDAARRNSLYFSDDPHSSTPTRKQREFPLRMLALYLGSQTEKLFFDKALVQESLFFSGGDNGPAAMHSKLVTQMLDVIADRFRGNDQRFRDFLVGVASG